VYAEEEPTTLLDALSDWQRWARVVADEAGQHGTKKAVERVRMTEEEQKAVSRLYAGHQAIIEGICRDAYDARVRAKEDEPSVSLEDVEQEAYILLLRALVRHEGKRDFERFLRRPFRDRVQDYLDSRLEHYPNEPAEDRDPLPSTTSFEHLDIVLVVDELVENLRLSDTAEEQAELENLWAEIRGISGSHPPQ